MMTQQYASELVSVLKKEAIDVRFLKKDGTIRNMKCTLNFDFIPDDKHPKSDVVKICDTIDCVKVFDLDVLEWRSFLVENIKRWQNEYRIVNFG